MDSHESMEAKGPVQDSTVGVCIVGKKEFKRKTHQGLAGHGANAITTSGRTLSSISRGSEYVACWLHENTHRLAYKREDGSILQSDVPHT